MRLTINIIKIFIIMKIKITESQYTKLNEDIGYIRKMLRDYLLEEV
jgi:hypothetical protein